jgi:hypothetical protein
MSRPFALIALSLLILVLPGSSAAQQFATSPVRDEKSDAVIEKKALELLETISEQVSTLHSPANRVRAKGAIADLLWTRDEKRARALIKSASEDLTGLIAAIDFSDPEVYLQLQWINQERQDIVTRIGEHDPDLALSFLRETRPQPATDSRPKWYSEFETNLELQLASRIAARDPARALQLARTSLARGISWNLIGFLHELQQKDPKSAQTLYQEIVARIKDQDLGRDQEAANPAWSLLSSFRPPQADEDTYRDLIATLVSAALTVTPSDQSSINLAQNINGQMNSVMPQIEKYEPARASALRQWSQNVERMSDPGTRMWRELNQVSQSGTVEDMLALALKYPRDFQNQIYQSAAWKAFSSGDINRARQIVSDFVSDPIQRRQMLDQFDNLALSTAINENRIEEARQLLGKIKTVDQRVQIFTQLAARLAGKGDKKGALDLLIEAHSYVDSLPPDSKKMWAQIQLAQSYSSLDPEQSFAILQPLIVRANELIAAAAVLDGFDYRYLKDGEWLSPGGNTLGNLIHNLEQTLAMLARLDFDHARALADQLERPELRLMAQLGIAQAALGGKFGSPPVNGRRIMTKSG